MGFGVQQSDSSHSWARILMEESELSLKKRGVKRRRTFRRMYLSVFVLFGASTLLYCSLFYVGAFIDPGRIIGVSYSKRALETQKSARSMADTSPKKMLFSRAFEINRVYLRAGQEIQATYSIPKGAFIELKIKQCKSRPVLEIFKCRFIGEQKSKRANKASGFVKFRVTEPGFYYFQDKVIKTPSRLLERNTDYRIVWQRA